MKRKQTIKRARIFNRDRSFGGARRILSHRDFSSVEDDIDAFHIIRNLAARAGINAAAEARSRGLSRVYLRNNKLIKLSAEGKAIVIDPKIVRTSFFVKYQPSTILDAVKK